MGSIVSLAPGPGPSPKPKGKMPRGCVFCFFDQIGKSLNFRLFENRGAQSGLRKPNKSENGNDSFLLVFQNFKIRAAHSCFEKQTTPNHRKQSNFGGARTQISKALDNRYMSGHCFMFLFFPETGQCTQVFESSKFQQLKHYVYVFRFLGWSNLGDLAQVFEHRYFDVFMNMLSYFQKLRFLKIGERTRVSNM